MYFVRRLTRETWSIREIPSSSERATHLPTENTFSFRQSQKFCIKQAEERPSPEQRTLPCCRIVGPAPVFRRSRHPLFFSKADICLTTARTVSSGCSDLFR